VIGIQTLGISEANKTSEEPLHKGGNNSNLKEAFTNHPGPARHPIRITKKDDELKKSGTFSKETSSQPRPADFRRHPRLVAFVTGSEQEGRRETDGQRM